MILDTVEEIMEDRSGQRWGQGRDFRLPPDQYQEKKFSPTFDIVFLKYCSCSNIIPIDFKLY